MGYMWPLDPCETHSFLWEDQERDTCYRCGAGKEKGSSFSDQESATATTEPLVKEPIMNKVIKTPATVQDLFRTAREVGMLPSELIGLFDDALGENWHNEGIQEVTLRDMVVPDGFTPLDEVVGTYVGKRIDGDRWTILSEWSATAGFSLTFWTTDDEAMTVTETNDYIGALMNMTAYVTKMEHGITIDVEA